jgi:pSer/pThr/pTyr-binding forkhead associated (FHA) protein
LADDPLSPFISRYHCLFDIDPPAIRVQDLGSRNGTYVNGDNIGRRPRQPAPEGAADGLAVEYPLADGDQILLGGIPLRVHVTEAPSHAEAGDGAPVV